jgi:hypothetical protein
VPSHPAGITVSNHALITVSDALRQRRTLVGTRWRRLSAGQEALLVVAYIGFGIGTTTMFRYLREALDVLAALAPSLQQAMLTAAGKAFVIIDGTLLPINRVGMASGRDRPYSPETPAARGERASPRRPRRTADLAIGSTTRRAARHGRANTA